MVIELNLFETLENLEPKCPKCRSVLDYGTNTFFDDRLRKHVCGNCRAVVS